MIGLIVHVQVYLSFAQLIQGTLDIKLLTTKLGSQNANNIQTDNTGIYIYICIYKRCKINRLMVVAH